MRAKMFRRRAGTEYSDTELSHFCTNQVKCRREQKCKRARTQFHPLGRRLRLKPSEGSRPLLLHLSRAPRARWAVPGLHARQGAHPLPQRHWRRRPRPVLLPRRHGDEAVLGRPLGVALHHAAERRVLRHADAPLRRLWLRRAEVRRDGRNLVAGILAAASDEQKLRATKRRWQRLRLPPRPPPRQKRESFDEREKQKGMRLAGGGLHKWQRRTHAR